MNIKFLRSIFRCLIVLLIIGFAHFGMCQELVLTGVNKGESLYIKNPYKVSTGSFCIQFIQVNGKPLNLNLNLSAINVSFDDFEKYSPVSVKVVHADSCQPRIVNPEAILYYSSFKFDSVVMRDTVLHWFTKGDKPEGVFIVEQRKADRSDWSEVASIRSKGKFNGTQYVYFPEHGDGGNKYRVKYFLPSGRFLYSEEIEHYHYPEGVTFSPKMVTDYMYLSREARFEIIDGDGEVILKGTAKKIPLRKLKPGDYSIMLDGDIDSFVKK